MIGCSPELELLPMLVRDILPFRLSLDWSVLPCAGVPGVAGVLPPELGVLLDGVPGVRHLPGVPGVRLGVPEGEGPVCRDPKDGARRLLCPEPSMSWRGLHSMVGCPVVPERNVLYH